MRTLLRYTVIYEKPATVPCIFRVKESRTAFKKKFSSSFTLTLPCLLNSARYVTSHTSRRLTAVTLQTTLGWGKNKVILCVVVGGGGWWINAPRVGPVTDNINTSCLSARLNLAFGACNHFFVLRERNNCLTWEPLHSRVQWVAGREKKACVMLMWGNKLGRLSTFSVCIFLLFVLFGNGPLGGFARCMYQ